IFIIADIVNGLMAFPNLIGLIGLRHVIVSETEIFFNDLRVKGDSAVEEKMTV
ncbi:MAG: sodium:alanine symporter family protein, partial [Clostridium sp.]|nr:sodium:alanine symporter family protein [Clostridium sp.]